MCLLFGYLLAWAHTFDGNINLLGRASFQQSPQQSLMINRPILKVVILNQQGDTLQKLKIAFGRVISLPDILINIQEPLLSKDLFMIINVCPDITIEHSNYTKIVVRISFQKLLILLYYFVVNDLSLRLIFDETQLHPFRHERTPQHYRSIISHEDHTNRKSNQANGDHDETRPHLFLFILLLQLLQFSPLCRQPHELAKFAVPQHPCSLLENRVEVAASVNLNVIIDKDPHQMWMAMEKLDHSEQQIIASINLKQKGGLLPPEYYRNGYRLFLKLIDNINCYNMKLQIISRLSKNQKPRIDSIKEILTSNVYMHTETGDRRQNMNQYYSINTDWTNSHQQNTSKFNPRDFFNNFNALCEVNYEPIDYKPIETKRRLLGILEAKRNLTKAPQMYPQRQESIANKLSQLENDPKYNQFSQRAKQKIRKVNSLISLDHEENSNKIEASRKPGFIKQNKSIKKKESSLQTSKVFQANKESMDINQNSKMQIKYRSSMGAEIDDSKERIANIRKELNEIYQMRNRHGQNKLRLN